MEQLLEPAENALSDTRFSEHPANQFDRADQRWVSIRKTLVSLFILLNLILWCSWFVYPRRVHDSPLRLVQRIWVFFALYQRWSPFAPMVPTQSKHLTATITFANGLTRLYEFPRMETLSIWERLQKHRWRKFQAYLVGMSKFRDVQVDCARFLARLVADERNVPVMISLTSHLCQIPPPEPLIKRCDLPTTTRSRAFFVYRCPEKGLQQ